MPDGEGTIIGFDVDDIIEYDLSSVNEYSGAEDSTA